MTEPNDGIDIFGLPRDLPAGSHPLDNYIKFMVAILGYRKAAYFFGIDPDTGEQIEPRRER